MHGGPWSDCSSRGTPCTRQKQQTKASAIVAPVESDRANGDEVAREDVDDGENGDDASRGAVGGGGEAEHEIDLSLLPDLGHEHRVWIAEGVLRCGVGAAAGEAAGGEAQHVTAHAGPPEPGRNGGAGAAESRDARRAVQRGNGT